MKKHLGISSHFGFDLLLEQRLQLISQAGFSSTFILFEEEDDFIKKNETQKIPELVNDSGLLLEHIHASYKDANLIWSRDLSDQKKIKTYYQDCIKFCSKYSIPHLVVHPSQSSTPPSFSKSGLKIFADLTLLAQDQNVKIAVENTRVDSYTDFILDNIKSKNLGLCYDTSHDNLYGNPAFGLLQKYSKRLFVTHISDNLGDKDSHTLPWRGNFDWKKFVDIFSGIKYGGTLTLEVAKEKDDDQPSDFLNLAFETAKKLHKMIGNSK